MVETILQHWIFSSFVFPFLLIFFIAFGILEKSKLFPGFMTSLIAVGEESGRLDEALSEIASSYERDTDETLKVLTSLLEPLIILLMGLVVGFLVIAMLLPVFQMNTMTG